MTDKDIGVLKFISKMGNTLVVGVEDPKEAFYKVLNALRDNPNGVVQLDGIDEVRNTVPAIVVLSDVSAVILTPPPSSIARPVGPILVDPKARPS